MLRIVKALLKRWGNSSAKRRVWNQEFSGGSGMRLTAAGRSTSLVDSKDTVYNLLQEYCNGGDILDLGCGARTTGLEIADTYRRYVGVDISDVAIQETASAAQRDPARASRNLYLVADISTFTPDGRFSVILFRESIYYFSKRDVKTILRRYSDFLSQDGVFVVRLHDRHKFRWVVSLIENHYRVLQRCSSRSGRTLVLVFSPRPGSRQSQGAGAGHPPIELRDS